MGSLVFSLKRSDLSLGSKRKAGAAIFFLLPAISERYHNNTGSYGQIPDPIYHSALQIVSVPRRQRSHVSLFLVSSVDCPTSLCPVHARVCKIITEREASGATLCPLSHTAETAITCVRSFEAIKNKFTARRFEANFVSHLHLFIQGPAEKKTKSIFKKR